MAVRRWSMRRAVRSVVSMSEIGARRFGEMVGMMRYVETVESIVFVSANMQYDLTNAVKMNPSAGCWSAVPRCRQCWCR